ncbi:MAG: DUF1259 domain-containing protein [Deltaproteobacteria bacterium]|nr:DUF1259 domain-containing protein [Deltaproteobacteria bacterium]
MRRPIAWPRTDERVVVDGAPLDPAAGPGSWAAFWPADGAAVVVGDTVAFEDEITPALDAALASGLEMRALHDYFVFDRTPVYFLHMGGYGDANGLAAGVNSVWDAIRAVRKARPQPGDRTRGEPPACGTPEAGASTGAGRALNRSLSSGRMVPSAVVGAPRCRSSHALARREQARHRGPGRSVREAARHEHAHTAVLVVIGFDDAANGERKKATGRSSEA